MAAELPTTTSPIEHRVVSRITRWRNCIVQIVSRSWQCILQFTLVLWIVRVPLATTVAGLLLLGLAPQAQDLFAGFTLKEPLAFLPFLYVQPLPAISFLFVLVAVWAMPTHYAARLLVDTDVRLQNLLDEERELKQTKHALTRPALCVKSSSIFVPRALGLLTFLAVLIAILRSYLNMPTLTQPEVTSAARWALVEMAVLVTAGALGFIVYARNRPRDANVPILRAIKRQNAKLSFFWTAISPGRVRDDADEEARDVGRLLLFSIFVIFLAIFCFGADFAGQKFPRAMAVPFVLGGWLPFLAYLSGVGRQLRAPLILGAFGLAALLALVLGDNHSVRRIEADRVAGVPVDKTPLALQAAVQQWMTENHCRPTGSDETNVRNCPRPIIIAAAGGASRAAFFLATVVGYFMQESTSNGLDPNKVRERLFAISSVSGGSVGAVMVTAALAAKDDSNTLPCVRADVDQWWGETINNWRDCFEALTSGDFLTADFFGFAFNDTLPFGPWHDRAAVLEDTWTRRYHEVVTSADKSAILPGCEGLECPFLALRPRPGHWVPLLVLNGTSEATGGRIITTPLALTYAPHAPANTTEHPCPTAVGPDGCQLFVQVDRFHDLLHKPTEPDRWFGWLGFFERYLLRGTTGDDVSLSTAAHNSARFPFISPPGSIRNAQAQMIVDRIVDGGYFENYGALAAKELALAVHAIQPTLKPLVIVISNDPGDLLDLGDSSPTRGRSKPPRPQIAEGEPLTDVVAPLTTFANSRTAHGIFGVAELGNALHAAIPECPVVIQVRVWPDHGKPLSMSWWESPLVQRQLHRQTEDGKDENRNGPHLNAIWQQMKASSGSICQ